MEQHYAAWRKAFKKRNIDISKEEFLQQEGQGLSRIARILGERFGLSTKDREGIIEDKKTFYNESLKIELYDGFTELLKKIKARAIPMGVVTGGTRARVEPVLKEYFHGYFDCLVSVDDTARGKPYADPYLKGAEMLGIEPGACVVVENAPLGIRAGKSAGMYVIAIETTLKRPHLSEADAVVADFPGLESRLSTMFELVDK